MTIPQQVEEEIKEAMRARDTVRLSVLRMLKSAFKYAALESGGAEGAVADEAAIPVIRKQIKQRRDSIEGFEKGGRTELAEKERVEIAVLEKFLPAALGADELAALVRDAIAETGAAGKAQMGAVMKLVMARAAGRADGKAVNQEVARQLG